MRGQFPTLGRKLAGDFLPKVLEEGKPLLVLPGSGTTCVNNVFQGTETLKSSVSIQEIPNIKTGVYFNVYAREMSRWDWTSLLLPWLMFQLG